MFVTIVLDGVGIGAQPDSHRYGDDDSNTLAHVCSTARPSLPNLAALGLGCITPLDGIRAPAHPRASYGKMTEASAGKDSTTGHWELAGICMDRPFPTYQEGFPKEVIDRFLDATGCDAVLGNRPASGTVIVAELGEEHQRTGYPIVYTSADSVFQVAAHKETIPLDRLYELCRIAREKVCVGDHAVGRVIARPFLGSAGAYERASGERKDFSLPPPREAVQEVLRAAGVRTAAVGKIGDLFARIGFDESYKTSSNAAGIAETLRLMQSSNDRTFVWTNLVDFDQEYGHRNDPDGFARALEAFDARVPELIDALPVGGRLVITADHGNDPTTPSTDHSREFVPLLLCGGREGRHLGVRATFADHAATVAAYFDVPYQTTGRPFEDFR